MRAVLGIILVFVAFSASGQFKVGGFIGGATTSTEEDYDLAFGFDGYYMLGNPDKFLKVGLATGFNYYIGGETINQGITTETPDAQFIPVAGALRFTLFKVITFGPDVGYGLGLNGKTGSGFYIRFIGGIDIANAVELNLTAHSINLEGNNIGAVGAGFLIHIY
jgi:hypothetical protein